MKNKYIAILLFFYLALPNTVVASESFTALCTLKVQHHYHLANKPDFHPAKNPARIIDEWSINNEYSASITLNYTEGDEYLQITDSRRTEPVKAPIIFYNGNTMFAIHLAKGANNGASGATTRTYSVNKKAESIVTTTLKSGSFMSARIEASAEGSPECVFK